MAGSISSKLHRGEPQTTSPHDGQTTPAPLIIAPPENNHRKGPPRNPVFWLLATLSAGAATSVTLQHGLWGGLAVFIVTIIALLVFHRKW